MINSTPPGFSLHFKQTDRIPQLAWIARLSLKASEIFVEAGQSVELLNDGFAEGAWSGSFDSKGLSESKSCCATGMVIKDDFVDFIAPSHTIQAIYSLKIKDAVLISNSLCFLIAKSGQSILPSYAYYETDLMTVMLGLSGYKRKLPLSGGNSVEVHYHCHLRFFRGGDSHYKKVEKQKPPIFANYEQYTSYLEEEVALIIKNATAPERRTQYPPLATVSTGYDSPMCAALAKKAGCTQGFTLITHTPKNSTESDNGRAIGEHLGLAMSEVHVAQGKTLDWMTEAEFIATGFGSDDLVFAETESLMKSRLVFVGMHGDKIWDTHLVEGGNDIVRGDPSGSSMCEFRLRVGFILVPVPFLGATRYQDITKISLSDEMKAWRASDPSYDRPVPRRYVETRGIPRSAFGQHKKVVANPLHPTGCAFSPIDTLLGDEACRRFKTFLEQHESGHAGPAFHKLMHRFGQKFLQRLIWNKNTSALLRKIGAISLCKRIVWRYSKPWAINYFLFHWANLEISKRYV